ncbi:MAG: polysaccharide deacetylase family protein [Solobacterium sp.]|nr:polysaccharide deacetylase family protein [Solobacterium sp.]
MTAKRNYKRKRKRRLKKGAKIFLTALGAVFCVILLCVLLNRYTLDLQLTGPETVYVEYGQPYEEQGAAAAAKGSTLFFITRHPDVVIQGEVGSEIGTYTLTYRTEFKKDAVEKTRTVIVQDTTPPEISLHTNPDYYTLPNTAYEEEGYTAYDLHDQDLTEQVVREETDGKVLYTVTDYSGNTATVERPIVYNDPVPPEIFLSGGDEIVCINGEEFHDSYYAEDNVDGNITERVNVEGNLDTSTDGDYTLVYTVRDSYDNEARVERTVHVVTRPAQTDGYHDAKTIYLTFDDGPWKYTDELLDILARYNVKATFFVTGAYPDYYYCIKKEAEQGHTVAVHTATHDYAKIYASQDAYWADFDRMNAIIEEQTGQRTTMFRFPGGSSNTISANYSKGVMSRLVNDAALKGYQYFDWNISSGDAGETTDTQRVYQNVINGIQRQTNAGLASMVLQHDIKAFSINAVEDIIKWGLENGYTFKAITPTTFGAHHGVNN